MPSLLESLDAFESGLPPAPASAAPCPLDDWKQRRQEVRELALRAGYPPMPQYRNAHGPTLWGYAITDATAPELLAMEAALRAYLEDCQP